MGVFFQTHVRWSHFQHSLRWLRTTAKVLCSLSFREQSQANDSKTFPSPPPQNTAKLSLNYCTIFVPAVFTFWLLAFFQIPSLQKPEGFFIWLPYWHPFLVFYFQPNKENTKECQRMFMVGFFFCLFVRLVWFWLFVWLFFYFSFFFNVNFCCTISDCMQSCYLVTNHPLPNLQHLHRN